MQLARVCATDMVSTVVDVCNFYVRGPWTLMNAIW